MKEKEKLYIKLDNALLSYKGLSLTAKVLLAHIVYFKIHGLRETNEQLATRLGVERRTIARALTELETYNLVIINFYHEKGFYWKRVIEANTNEIKEQIYEKSKELELWKFMTTKKQKI